MGNVEECSYFWHLQSIVGWLLPQTFTTLFLELTAIHFTLTHYSNCILYVLLSGNQSHLLVCRRDQPYFSKNKNDITKFWLISFFKYFYSKFLLYYFMFLDKSYNNHNNQLIITMTEKDSLYVWSSRWSFSIRKSILRNFGYLTEKHLCCSLFLITLQVLRPAM